jgi:cell division septal protein FtsQ
MLRAYETEEQREVYKREKTKKQAKAIKRQRWVLLRRAVLMGILLGVTGIIFAIVLSILLYG